MSRKTILPNIAYDSQRRTFYVTFRVRPKRNGPVKRTVRCYPTLELAIQALDRRKAGEGHSRKARPGGGTGGQWVV